MLTEQTWAAPLQGLTEWTCSSGNGSHLCVTLYDVSGNAPSWVGNWPRTNPAGTRRYVCLKIWWTTNRRWVRPRLWPSYHRQLWGCPVWLSEPAFVKVENERFLCALMFLTITVLHGAQYFLRNSRFKVFSATEHGTGHDFKTHEKNVLPKITKAFRKI